MRGKAATALPTVSAASEGNKKRRAAAERAKRVESVLRAASYAGYHGPGQSPDRADAMVWAMTELCKPPQAVPRVRVL